MSKPSISILGCGWLGFPLAKNLLQLNYSVKGSTTSPDKIPLLNECGINAFCLECLPELKGGRFEEFFDSETLFLNIPYRRNLEDPYYYKEQVEDVLRYVAASSIRFIIFASSTSIYEDHIGLAREDLDLSPYNLRSKVLLEVENSVQSVDGVDATIVRFSGLYGGDRKIGKFLSGKNNLKHGESPVNLIHLDDSVAIVSAIIQQNIKGELLNAVSDFHPTRKELYTIAAEKLNVPLPDFIEETDHPHKIVLNDKLKKILNYQFVHSNPMDDVS